MNPRFKTKTPPKILVDSRFITIINHLNTLDKNSAIYLIRLITGFNLVVAKNYIAKRKLIYRNCRNKLQGYNFEGIV